MNPPESPGSEPPGPDAADLRDPERSSGSSTGRSKRLLIQLAKVTLCGVVGYFLWQEVRSGWRELHGQGQPPPDWSRIRYGYLALASLIYLGGLSPMAWYWHRLLGAMGHAPPAGATLRAFYVGHLGKYVPGKAMVVVLRSGLLSRYGVPGTLAAVSVFAETLTMMSVGAGVAAGVLTLLIRDDPWLIALACGLMLAAGTPTLPPVFRLLVRRMRLAKLDPAIDDRLRHYTFPLVIQGWCANIVGWWLLGLSLWAVIAALPTAPDMQTVARLLPRLTASVSLAVVAGFLSLLPGGVLVREYVLNRLLIQPLGRPTAVLAAILLRLVWLLSEAVISIILYGVAHLSGDPAPDPPPSSADPADRPTG